MSPDLKLAVEKTLPSTLVTIGFSLLVFSVLFIGTRGTRSTTNALVLTPPSSTAPLDACTLIETAEIASVQGLPVQQAQPTSQKHGDLEISQCYYTAISADGLKNLSVFVQVIQPDPKSARRNALREFWEEKFERERKEDGREEKEAGEAIDPPMHVSGLGKEALWLGNSRGGALFVLKNNKLLRVSVGDADAKVQIEKSKTLARKALARLA